VRSHFEDCVDQRFEDRSRSLSPLRNHAPSIASEFWSCVRVFANAMNFLSPTRYLADVIPRVQDQPNRRLDELLPGPWSRAQTAA
jgi:hypothetical protein